MKAKIFKKIFAATTSIFLIFLIMMVGVQFTFFSNRHSDLMKKELEYLVLAANANGTDFLKDKEGSSDMRITHISSNGQVLFDSSADISSMDNHSERQEIKDALKSGFGESSRYSNTIMEETVYYAQKLNDGTILRISSTRYTVFTLLINIIYPLLGALALSLLISAFLAARVSSGVTEPINNIDLENPDERDVYDELKPLVQRINAQNRQIHTQMDELKKEHKKQDKMRREFTANVSHELKTPLTSISGYAEIIKDGMVRKEDIERFAEKIYDETQRLIILVGDIIKLSQLDGGEVISPKVDIDLYDVCQKTLTYLESSAESKHIFLSLDTDPSDLRPHIMGYEKIIHEIVYNLCDNAIKYNREKGVVAVSLSENSENIILSVSDTGIGIPQNEIDRVFERFYRVDKSHSKEVGGTGLGLSIVKHGVSLHGARVELKSSVGFGTTVSVFFNKQ